jgi:hypothetical protein
MSHARIKSAVLTIVVGVGLLAASSVTAIAQNSTRGLSTQRIIVRPVSYAGHVTPGYHVTTEPNSSLDCTFPSASPASVDSDVLACSPDSEYALACWLSRTPHRTLCLRDARTKQLVSIHRKGAMAQALPYKVRAPLDLVLTNGTLCTLRDGGAGASLQGHPTWAAFYYCQHNQAIWAPGNARNWGIDRSHALWTARTAPENGHGSLTTSQLARAWFVGMHS